MSKRTRRHFTVEQKVALLRRHLVDKVAVSELCDEAKIPPSTFYEWQRQLFERMASAFDTPTQAPSREKDLEKAIAQLNAKLARKDEVIAHISEEHVKLKKELGGAPAQTGGEKQVCMETIVDMQILPWEELAPRKSSLAASWVTTSSKRR